MNSSKEKSDMRRISLASLKSSFMRYFEPEAPQADPVSPPASDPLISAAANLRRRSQSLGHLKVTQELPTD